MGKVVWQAQLLQASWCSYTVDKGVLAVSCKAKLRGDPMTGSSLPGLETSSG